MLAIFIVQYYNKYFQYYDSYHYMLVESKTISKTNVWMILIRLNPDPNIQFFIFIIESKNVLNKEFFQKI